MNIVLLILKILGIVLLSLLVILLLLLSVPVKYGLTAAAKEQDIKADFHGQWFFGLVKAVGHFDREKKLSASADLFRKKLFRVPRAAEACAPGAEGSQAAVSEEETEDKAALSSEEKKRNREKKKKALRELSKDESFGPALRQLLRSGKSMLRRILPRKGEGHLLFGTGDPYRTGQILSLMALCWPLYGRVFEVSPDFTDKCLDMDVSAEGHFCLLTLGICVLRLVLSRNVRRVYALYKEIADEKSE